MEKKASVLYKSCLITLVYLTVSCLIHSTSKEIHPYQRSFCFHMPREWRFKIYYLMPALLLEQSYSTRIECLEPRDIYVIFMANVIYSVKSIKDFKVITTYSLDPTGTTALCKAKISLRRCVIDTAWVLNLLALFFVRWIFVVNILKQVWCNESTLISGSRK